MEEASILSGATTQRSHEVSDSNSSIHQFPVKNPTASSSRFKGVVNQLNGHWGAQIYANHQRIWLGTFKSEEEAAKAYDTAAIKLRNGEAHRNFPWNHMSVQEPKFQSLFSTEAILCMIRDGSYATKFSDYLMAQIRQGHSHSLTNFNAPSGIKLRHLFEKELTPSDVSKLNRLVIPKRCAVMYFPQFPDQSGGIVDDMELVFYDQTMRVWKFRYCYWKSSQSFVFTRGWNRFTKEKGLKARDRVIFSAGECGDGSNEVQKMCMIDVSYYNGTVVEGNGEEVEFPINGHRAESENAYLLAELGRHENENEDENGRGEVDINVGTSSTNAKKKGLKLFGVQIV
ncbi:hypothetical protein CDL12_11488 [Handroanthus impetiginosus]|uniref:AP2/ERF and B3 domain-containing transcription factor n=1 Tax=Handroanthus impetiginosus TaxID=429701 RepID=A0A2G9HEB3_9LAMI|nr:hypothetical protein CDL12_11488 [Handroanthus impetiginosus]